MSLLLASQSAGADQTLLPALFTNTNTFYAPTISLGAVTLSPELFSNTNTFYAATITGGAVAQARSTMGGIGHGSSRQKFLEVDGRLVRFNSEAEIIDYLESLKPKKIAKARKIAAKAMREPEKAAIPFIKLPPIDIAASYAIRRMVEDINRDIRIAFYLSLKVRAERDDEDILLFL